MTMRIAVALAGLIASPVVGQDPQPEVVIYRSWQAPDVTVVNGLFRVEPALLGTANCTYGVQLTVRDDKKNVLKQDQWDGRCPEQNGNLAAALETFTFAVTPAHYTVEVSVYPQGDPARKRTRTVNVAGLPANTRASDLILAREIGSASDSSRTWTMRRGRTGLQTSSQIVVMPADPKLNFYMELYGEPSRPLNGKITGSVRRLDGRSLVDFRIDTLQALSVGTPVKGSVPLDGLAPGTYTFETRIQLADTTLVRSHRFTMASPVVVASGPAGWFGTLTDERLVELFDGVSAFGISADEAEFYASLPPHARRNWLATEFGPEGPTPNDGNESAIDAYLARIDVVNARFAQRAGRGAEKPWQTDRGKIWLLRGQPSSIVPRPSPAAGAPYEIWHYATGPGYAYLFADETRMGHYRMIYTNDPNKQGVPDWDRRVGGEALEDLSRLGIRARITGNPGGGGGN